MNIFLHKLSKVFMVQKAMVPKIKSSRIHILCDHEIKRFSKIGGGWLQCLGNYFDTKITYFVSLTIFVPFFNRISLTKIEIT